MKKQITLIVAVLTVISAVGVTNAQDPVGGQYQQPALTAVPQTIPQPVVQTVPQTQTYVAPQARNQYYFGMRLELLRDYGGNALRVVDVTWGSPAQQAGLEAGDQIRTVNGRGFHGANDSFQAVNMMNQYVSFSGGGTAVAAAPTGGATTYIRPLPSTPIANMIVRNVRNGQNVSVTVRPVFQGNAIPTATTASAPVGN